MHQLLIELVETAVPWIEMVGIGEKTALGLDFFLAGGIIQTIMVPGWESLAILGGIVVIRTVIAFFLNKDLRELAEK